MIIKSYQLYETMQVINDREFSENLKVSVERSSYEQCENI